MDAAAGWSSELAYAALRAITTEPIGQSSPHTARTEDPAHRFSLAALLTHPTYFGAVSLLRLPWRG